MAKAEKADEVEITSGDGEYYRHKGFDSVRIHFGIEVQNSSLAPGSREALRPPWDVLAKGAGRRRCRGGGSIGLPNLCRHRGQGDCGLQHVQRGRGGATQGAEEAGRQGGGVLASPWLGRTR